MKERVGDMCKRCGVVQGRCAKVYNDVREVQQGSGRVHGDTRVSEWHGVGWGGYRCEGVLVRIKMVCRGVRRHERQLGEAT